MSQSNILIQANYEDLQKIINTEIANIKLEAYLNRFENVLVKVSDIAHIHNVSTTTVRNYIKDGLISSEMQVQDSDNLQFRLSYVLTLDFKELRKQLRFKLKGY